jgi:hypothetical protein
VATQELEKGLLEQGFRYAVGERHLGVIAVFRAESDAHRFAATMPGDCRVVDIEKEPTEA